MTADPRLPLHYQVTHNDDDDDDNNNNNNKNNNKNNNNTHICDCVRPSKMNVTRRQSLGGVQSMNNGEWLAV